MAILTKFLKLLKPEKNDYVDVEKHLSENYDKIDTKMEELSNSNDEKLNKGAVSSEYDTAKKIEDKVKVKIDEDKLWEAFHRHGVNKNVDNFTNQQFNELGLCSIYYTDDGKNNWKPSTYGQLINIPADKGVESTQLWIEQASGRLYSRGGNGIGAIKDTEFQKYMTTDDCPYRIGDIYLTTNPQNPSLIWLGTTWQKIEGRFLLGTSGGGASKQTGGSMSKTIQQGNLPNIKLRVDSFSLTTQPHKHGIASSISVFSSNGGWRNLRLNDDGNISGSVQSLSAGGQNTGSASPQTSALGSGQALDITPSFYTTHMWLRTS